MSSTEPKTVASPSSRPVSAEEQAQAKASADLQAALQRIASHIVDADRRHARSLDRMQARLDLVGRRVDEVRVAAAEPEARTLDRLEQEIAALSERIASFGQERQLQRGEAGIEQTHSASKDEEPWDARSAEALIQANEMMQAELARGQRTPRATEPARAATSAALAGPAREQGGAIDKAWLESRLAGIAAALQQALAENNPARSLAALGQRLDQMEARFETALGDVSKRLGGDWLKVVEDHVKELAVQFEATSRQLARLDAIDGQLQQIARALEEQRQAARAPSGMPGEDAIVALIDSAAERTASRLSAALPTPEAESGRRIDALEGLMQDYIAERRRSEETTSSSLNTIEEALIRIIDRLDAIETPAPGAHGSGEADEVSGMDLEGERLAEAYAAGVRVLGHPGQPTLDASDYLASPEHGQGPSRTREDAGTEGDAAPAAAPANQTREELRASAMRAKLKAQAAAVEGAAAGPSGLRADTPPAGDKPGKRAGSFRSRFLIGSAMAFLFIAGYLSVDLLIAHGMPAGLLQAAAPKPRVAPRSAGPVEPSAGERPTRQPAAAPAANEDRTEPAPVPVPRPVERTPRPADEIDQAEQGTTSNAGNRYLTGLQMPGPAPQAKPAAEPAAVAPQNPAAATLQEGQLAGAATAGDALPTEIGSNALREAAAKGDATAQFEIAARFAEGIGVPQDQKKAFLWYERAATRGLASAQFRLGAYYERGIGVTADAERAKVWYRRAADQGHVRAMHNLGVLIADRGQAQADYAGAAHWFKEAARRGYVDSQFNLAVLYAHGRGVPRDLVESYMWFALAARAGDAGSMRRLEEIKAQLDPLEVQTAERKLAAWHAQSAEASPAQAGR